MVRNRKKGEKSHKLKQERGNPSSEGMEAEPEIDNNSSKVNSKKTVKKPALGVRRSGRLREAVMAAENHQIEQIIEEITVSESDEENEPADDEFPKPTMDEKQLHEKIEGKDIHEKVDYLVELLIAQQKAMSQLNSRRIGERSGVGAVKYKSMYLDSQKKIEALTEEIKKFRIAYAKIEKYYKKAGEEILKMKEIIGWSDAEEDAGEDEGSANGTKATEAADECETGKRKRS
ncbi:uncharacterized protein [Euphorbia lathyris]|uniref:uncharacterized protein isoform X2 n=1 Tax=Euphorbia lathyris TaxID=212925 RepID=UPI003313B9B8